MEVRRRFVTRPFFSVCIPQYDRTSFVIESCKSLGGQTFKDFEVCISDDCSTDGREKELLGVLEDMGLSFVYRKQERNTGYDGNLRASIGLSEGRYCFLLGNDDCLASPTTLEDLHGEIKNVGTVGVVITNYEEFATGKKVRRIRGTGPIGTGPVAAARHYRNLSFVSGVLLDGARAHELGTARWDGSEMYQMYVACRIIAEGGLLLGIDEVTVRKDIQIPGEQVDSYAVRPRVHPCPIVERRTNLDTIGRLVTDAVAPYLKSSERQGVIERIFWQLLLFTYPYWVVEYRRVQSWRYAVGICLGMRPRNLFSGLSLDRIRRARLSVVFFLSSLGGLLIPVRVFDSLRTPLYYVAKAVR